MYIKRVYLKNTRCFDELNIEFDLSGDAPPFTVVVGDNAAGKTTLLRAIAIGLCDEAGAAALIMESDVGFVRLGETNACIAIDLITDSGDTCSIKTTIEKNITKAGSFDIVSPTKNKFLFISSKS